MSSKDSNSAPLNHVAIIMDGNARWAKSQGLIRAQGHQRGAAVIKDLLSYAIDLDIKYLTLYAFSSENWHRSNEEVKTLLKILQYYLTKELNSLAEAGIRLKIIGNFTKLSKNLQEQIACAVEQTKNNDKITLCIAFSYGGRQEIVDACSKILALESKLPIDEDIFSQYLYETTMPNVDILIRTGGMQRISNFLLWQIAYAEIFFIDKYWPEFNKEDLIKVLAEYRDRIRNFGRRK